MFFHKKRKRINKREKINTYAHDRKVKVSVNIWNPAKRQKYNLKHLHMIFKQSQKKETTLNQVLGLTSDSPVESLCGRAPHEKYTKWKEMINKIDVYEVHSE